MRPFIRHEGRLVPLDRANVDTDQITPKQFCKRIERSGYGDCLFYNWRQEDPEFILDRPQHRGASILVAGDNFGCGSSREHAVWSIDDAGYRVVVAPSFGDIFRNNCHKVGVLPVVLPAADVRRLMDIAAADPGQAMVVDLETQTVRGGGFEAGFEIDPFVKVCLLQGWDDIGLTLRHAADIDAFEARLPSWIVPAEARRRALTATAP
jgi:3-isopropylmalate/(R)-2-methylmalate dehydratase small subunit